MGPVPPEVFLRGGALRVGFSFVSDIRKNTPPSLLSLLTSVDRDTQSFTRVVALLLSYFV